MTRKLDNLRWKPMWVSNLGCTKGCIDYLGIEASDAWLFGATGHAFIINIHDVVCPSGPTAWNMDVIYELGENVGYRAEGLFGFSRDPDFPRIQQLAWEKTRRAIDDGIPCFGWELDVPEYYVINGYDDQGYHFSGPRCDEGKGPKPWRELGASQIGVLEMRYISRGKKADDRRTVRDALSFALEHSASPGKWIHPKYRAGLAGFDSWIAALEGGTAHGWGMAYNAVVWAECRGFAVGFLREAGERLGGPVARLCSEAADTYGDVAESLKRARELFPFPPKGEEVKDRELCLKAAALLREARTAEEKGLEGLKRIVDGLG